MASAAAGPALAAWTAFCTEVETRDSTFETLQGLPGVEELCTDPEFAELGAVCALDQAKAVLSTKYLDGFWRQVSESSHNAQSQQLDRQLPEALQLLCHRVEFQCRQLEALGNKMLLSVSGHRSGVSCVSQLSSLSKHHRRSVSALVLATAPTSLSDLLMQYYSSKLSEFSLSLGGGSFIGGEVVDSEDELQTFSPHGALLASAADVMGQHWADQIRSVAECLRLLGLESTSEKAYGTALFLHIHDTLSRHTQDKDFTRCILPAAQKYLAAVPQEFLKLVLPLSSTNSEPVGPLLQQWKSRLDYRVYETLGELRIQELFDIVTDYNNSSPAVRDLHECLQHTNLQRRCVEVFRSALDRRLLQPAASTLDIIDHFVAMIKTISEVDPTGALLNAMTDQYRQYLHHRPDSMKCIVNKLTNSSDNGGASMLQELADAMDTQIDSDKEGEDDEMAFKAATAWEPDPIIDTEIVRRNEKRLNDVVSTLVGVYGSKDMFIEEYRKTLGEKLLSKTDYDCDHEIQTLELLKLRFDETALHNCEVMLKDMGDSKRINSTLVNNEGTSAAVERRSRRGEQLDQANLSATIISELFWPELPDTDIKLPPEIRQRLDVYADRYHQHKAPRKLVWRTGLGSVELAVTVGRTTRSFTVNPTYAMILYMFQALSRWTPDDLARELGLTPQVLRAKALFWVNNGVLVEARGRRGDMFYQRAEALDDRAGTAAPADLGLEDEGPSCMTPAPVQGHEELKAFETYIVDFLANGCNPGGCTLEQIHKHLRMFCIRPKYDKLQDQLAAYLATMMERNKVVHQGGLYKIKAGRST